MLRRTAVVALVLAAAGAPARGLWAAEPAAPPPPLAEARGDLDGDGRPERVHLERDGALVVDDADGKPRARVSLAAKQPIVRGEVRIVAAEGHVVVQARAELGRGRAVEAVLGDGGRQTIFDGRTGPVGDGERAIVLRVDDDGVVQYQTAAGFSRCDGDDMLFPERWDFGSGRFRPVTDDPPAGLKLRATAAAPSGLEGPPLGLFRFTAESTDASGDRRADRLAAPAELDDGKPSTAWHAGFGATARGQWVTARTQAGAPRVRALEIVPGKEAPRALALILGPSSDQQFTVELGAGVQWVVLPALMRHDLRDRRRRRAGRARQRARRAARVHRRRRAGRPRAARRRRRRHEAERRRRGAPSGRARRRGGAGDRGLLPTAQGLGRRRLLQVLATIRLGRVGAGARQGAGDGGDGRSRAARRRARQDGRRRRARGDAHLRRRVAEPRGARRRGPGAGGAAATSRARSRRWSPARSGARPRCARPRCRRSRRI